MTENKNSKRVRRDIFGPRPRSTAKALSRISLFGPPPLLEKEDAANYQKFLSYALIDLKPNDILEEIWCLDVVNLSWEVIRWHRLKAKLLNWEFEHWADSIERIDRFAMNAEARRNAALREIDRHRT